MTDSSRSSNDRTKMRIQSRLNALQCEPRAATIILLIDGLCALVCCPPVVGMAIFGGSSSLVKLSKTVKIPRESDVTQRCCFVIQSCVCVCYLGDCWLRRNTRESYIANLQRLWPKVADWNQTSGSWKFETLSSSKGLHPTSRSVYTFKRQAVQI